MAATNRVAVFFNPTDAASGATELVSRRGVHVARAAEIISAREGKPTAVGPWWQSFFCH